MAIRRGYQALELPLEPGRPGGAPGHVARELRLEMQPVGFFDTVEVRAQRSLPEQGALDDGLHLSGLDVLRTAGTHADVFRRAQMLPGVSKLDEGAGLFGRGGDADETATYLDRALLSHPYRLETPSGGFFGTVPPWLISGPLRRRRPRTWR